MPIFATNALEWCVECTVKCAPCTFSVDVGVVAMPNEENLLEFS